MINLFQMLQQNSPFFQELQIYDDGKRILDKSLRDKEGMEYYLISKKFIKQWKYYVDYDEEMEEIQLDPRQKPDKINSDLINNEKLFRYFPENHVYNSSIRYLENEWDYEFVLKKVYEYFNEIYQSIEPQIRVGFYNESLKRKQIFPNLARFTLIYQSPIDNKLYTAKAQVDYNSEIKAWTNLLRDTFQEQFKPKKINNVRVWCPRHKTFKADLLIQQMEKIKQVDGDILNENLIIFQMQSQRDNCIIIDLELNDWQFKKFEQTIEYDNALLLEKALYGCGKIVCEFPQCKLNNGYSDLGFAKEDIQGICQVLIENEEVKWELMCSKQKNITDNLLPFSVQIKTDPIQYLLKISQSLELFGISFVENYNKNQGIYQINPKNAEINSLLVLQIAQGLNQQKDNLMQIIKNLFQRKVEDIEPLTNLYQLRALYLILQFRNCLSKILDEKPFIILTVIRRLSQQQANQLSKWLTKLDKTELQQFQSITKKAIEQQINIQKNAPIRPLLDIDDIQRLKGLFDLYSVIYKSNIKNPRIPASEFIINSIQQFYKVDADRQEFTQFQIFNAKVWRGYSFTFCQYPWAMPIEFKSRLLSIECKVKQYDTRRRAYGIFPQFVSLTIERDNIIESAIKQLQQTQVSLKNPLKVQFVNEQGVDEGGPKREFFRLIMEKLVTPDYGMFIPKNNDTVFWFNPQSFEMPIYYSLIGKLLGLSLYNSVLLDVRFPTVLFKKLQREKLKEEDLKELDMETYTGFQFLREQTDPKVVESLGLTFNGTYKVWGENYFEDLKPNGFQINVTIENREEYIQLYIDWYLNKLVQKQFDLLKDGFKTVVDGDGIKLFSGEELQQLIIGLPTFDMKDLEASTKYDGYESDSEYIRYFWNCIHKLNVEMQKRFLFFCTGSDRIPVGGLKSIKFVIQKHGQDTEQLPSAHTCFNVLLLPFYKNKETLKEKLKISLDNAEGFGLM
ncbi:unnamed protein product (macronuclear) [Paramecium tetraurelia]|uniref:HECT-type E3 ubiquitin transferase n=1 Tax=Paramecium tetraurelia TaxID=5888 RepID=A0E4G5_PARTE|nr:uncharacterized protein GSPATT00023357001 [Paramecium tetraurelia]CAK90182.1 unnamed protein product [Paramecium tetraurelia]|eukprot:XP_001457579.1 hypothetical protein (macronuclear) [Paramecium tetraurelia strain d4-2]